MLLFAKTNAGTTTGAAILPELASHGQREILRHIASYLKAASTPLLGRVNFNGIKPKRLTEGFFATSPAITLPGELLGCVTFRPVALAFRQAIRGFAPGADQETISVCGSSGVLLKTNGKQLSPDL